MYYSFIFWFIYVKLWLISQIDDLVNKSIFVDFSYDECPEDNYHNYSTDIEFKLGPFR